MKFGSEVPIGDGPVADWLRQLHHEEVVMLDAERSYRLTRAVFELQEHRRATLEEFLERIGVLCRLPREVRS